MEWVAGVGVDWSDEKHDYVVECRSGERARGVFSSTPEAVHAWAAELRVAHPEGTIVVFLEQSRGALLYALSIYEYLVLVPINPRAISAYRESLYLSGAKDDPVDAELILRFGVDHLDRLRAWRADDAITRELRLNVEMRRELVDRRTALSQVLTDALKQYFPQILCWFGGALTSAARAFLKQWPTPEKARRAKADSIRELLGRRTRKSPEKIEVLLEQIRSAVSLTTDSAIIAAMSMRAVALVRIIEQIDHEVRTFDQVVAQHWRDHPDRELFESFPGAGPVLAPRLAVAFGTQRDRYADAAEMQNYSGTSPVMNRSGKHATVQARWSRPTFLHQTFHEFAGASIPHSPWARTYYRQQRAAGAGHHQALRALAFRWIRVIFACWQNRTSYAEQTYQAALKRRGSPLAALLAA
jgi:transposase